MDTLSSQLTQLTDENTLGIMTEATPLPVGGSLDVPFHDTILYYVTLSL